MTTKVLNSVNETLARVGFGKTKLYEEMDSGRLEYVMVGDRRFIPEDALAAYVQRLRDERERSTPNSPGVRRLLGLVDDDGRLDVDALPADASIADLRTVQEIIRRLDRQTHPTPD